MNQERTFADVPVGQKFFMNIGGMETECEKISATHLKAKSTKGEWIEMKAGQLWGPCEYPQEREARIDRTFRELQPRHVNGHSSTYPYGEH